MNTTRQQRNVWRVLIHEGPVAPWRQILEVIRGRISDGTYPAGSRLPSIVDLGHEFGVALTTVRKALDVLKAEGAILTSPMGTFIA
jgi:GntR family transcriptional regulator